MDQMIRLVVKTRPDSRVPIGAAAELWDITVGQIGFLPSSFLLVRRWGIFTGNHLLQAQKEINIVGGIRGVMSS